MLDPRQGPLVPNPAGYGEDELFGTGDLPCQGQLWVAPAGGVVGYTVRCALRRNHRSEAHRGRGLDLQWVEWIRRGS